MNDLLDALIAKNLNDCEEYARVITSNLNGLAGIHIILNEAKEAADLYRSVINFCTEFEDKSELNNKSITFTIDKLLLIHAIHNLSYVLNSYNLPRPIAEGDLENKCKELEDDYTKKIHVQTITAAQELNKISSSIEEQESLFQLETSVWYLKAIDWVIANDYINEFNTKVNNTLETQNLGNREMYE